MKVIVAGGLIQRSKCMKCLNEVNYRNIVTGKHKLYRDWETQTLS